MSEVFTAVLRLDSQPKVFVNGQRLTSVDAKSSLVTGAWWWDSANRRVCSLRAPSGIGIGS